MQVFLHHVSRYMIYYDILYIEYIIYTNVYNIYIYDILYI